MRTTKNKSVVSDLILACFILSLFLLMENSKESGANEKKDILMLSPTPQISLYPIQDSLILQRNEQTISYNFQ